MTGRLEGKVAIITGGAGGIGAATGALFCEQGCRVVLVDSDAEAMQAAASSIRAGVPAAQVVPVVADVGREETAAHVVAEAMKAFGALDVLVNLAGIRAYEPLGGGKARDLGRADQGQSSQLRLFHSRVPCAAPRLGRGSIINVASTHAVNPRAGMGQYDVTKAGIISLTKTLAFEEAKHGIRVNAVCPGATLTPFHLRRAKSAGQTREDLERGRRNHVPARPMGGRARGRLADSVARLGRSVLRHRFGPDGGRRPVHEMRQWPVRQSWHLISCRRPATMTSRQHSRYRALLTRQGKPARRRQHHCCAGGLGMAVALMTCWLQRAHDSRDRRWHRPFCEPTSTHATSRRRERTSTHDRRDNVLRTRERAHALNHGGAID